MLRQQYEKQWQTKKLSLKSNSSKNNKIIKKELVDFGSFNTLPLSFTFFSFSREKCEKTEKGLTTLSQYVH